MGSHFIYTASWEKDLQETFQFRTTNVKAQYGTNQPPYTYVKNHMEMVVYCLPKDQISDFEP